MAFATQARTAMDIEHSQSKNSLPGPTTYETDATSAETAERVPLAPPDKQPENLKIEEEPKQQTGWAIVGLGELALGEILPAFKDCHFAKPVALVSGHQEKARKVAKLYHIEEDSIYNYENFGEIAADADIHIVYIALPNSMHAEFAIRALQAGKHVFCEKPMAVSVEEGIAMQNAADEANRMLGIAYRLHYEPMNRLVMKWCKQKKFGPVKVFNSSNCQNVTAPNIRLSRELGGGPVGDVGIYSINAARYVIGEEPVEVTAFANQPEDDPRFEEVPESVSFILRYPSGALAVCDCSFGTMESRRYRVECSEGHIEMDPAFSYRGLKLTTAEKSDGRSEKSDLGLDEINQFAAEMDAFSKSVLQGSTIRTSGAMGIADLQIIAAIDEAIKTRTSVHVDI